MQNMCSSHDDISTIELNKRTEVSLLIFIKFSISGIDTFDITLPLAS